MILIEAQASKMVPCIAQGPFRQPVVAPLGNAHLEAAVAYFLNFAELRSIGALDQISDADALTRCHLRPSSRRVLLDPSGRLGKKALDSRSRNARGITTAAV